MYQKVTVLPSYPHILLLAIAEILMIALAVIIVLLWMSVISASAILLILFLLLMVLILAVLMLSDLAAAKLAVGSGDAAVALTEAFGFAFANPVEFAVLLFIYCVVLLVSAIIPFGRFFIETQINGIALLTLASSKKAAN